MTPPPDWTLGLLLGGESSRMGRDKAFLEIEGRTLAERIVASCRPVSDHILVSVGSESREVPVAVAGWTRISDRLPNRGPLGGIEALLRGAKTNWLVVVPCDMPYLTRDWIDHLVGGVVDGGGNLGCFCREGREETFPLVVSREALHVVGRALDEGRNKVRELSSELGIVVLPSDGIESSSHGARALDNINTPDDFEEAVKYFASLS